ncbi:carboxypeptidase regulatory-like domain-containing protein [Lysobacter maris]|uniref:Carboxypeptidase regulatory-like domain-containing protein n=1 Tax=Marilutibacter maris TaxID=1605891 RepID=A0A508B0V0_9GAMM|nr:carboxypeptidase regulatory-like domain-containing protein [Lysobacter maris]KAB8198496.1 carboxypeptidase regulatory-like domain-containing protein [Lysobacter maris]
MNANPSGDWLVALLSLAVAVAVLRLLWRQWRGPQRARGWWLALLLILQPLSAWLLYRSLVPPPLAVRSGTLTVLTAGATRAQLAATTRGEALVALPEAPEPGDAEAVPDLATALRRHPGTARIQVIGDGLEARDRDAVGGIALAFEPATLPTGVTGLWTPSRIAAGDGFGIGGRVSGVDGGSIELIDPSGQRVAAARLSDAGVFELDGTARAAGLATFNLQVFDAEHEPVERLAVPLQVTDPPAPRVLLLGGAPNPELRALRRWIGDAGMPLHAQIAVGAGVQLGDRPLPMTVDGLAEFDLVVLDERVWTGLGDTRRQALLAAVRQGLGLLLRVTGPLPARTRAQLDALGLAADAGTATTALTLPQPEGLDEAGLRARLGGGSEDAPLDLELVAAPPPRLLRRDLRFEGAAAVPLRGPAGSDWMYWKAHGRGRIGVSTLVDSYRLPLSGRGDLHAELWSAAFAALARGTAQPPRVDPGAREGHRVRICGVGEAASVTAPDGSTSTLLPDPAAGPERCAGYWPRVPGWHRLLQDGEAWPFHVRPSGEAPGLRAAALREGTLALAGGDASPNAADGIVLVQRRGASWPWWLAWLGSVALLWGLERWRRGLVVAG